MQQPIIPAASYAAPLRRALAVGDILPRVRGVDDGGRPFDLWSDHIAGNFLVVTTVPPLASARERAPLLAWRDRLGDIAALGIKLVGITGDTVAANAALRVRERLPLPLLSDPDGALLRSLGIEGDVPTTVLVRPNQRVLAIVAGADVDHAGMVRAAVVPLHARRGIVEAEYHPPVLMVPDVLSREDCRALIATYMLQGNEFVEPGHGSQNRTSDYKMRIPEYGRRDRIDHWIVNAATTDMIADRLGRRLFPEIEKVFQYRITRFERFRIGSYEGERGGEIHGHRDNTEPLVAHRRFACSVNLNTEEFEGGELRFPEYGEQRYRPETGAALVFSSSILHEPLHVTAGRRFVLLAFLFGDH